MDSRGGHAGTMIRVQQGAALVLVAVVGLAFALPLGEDATRRASIAGTVATALLMVVSLSWATRVNEGANRIPWAGTLVVYAAGLALFVADPIEPGPAGELSAAMLVGPLATLGQLGVVIVLARHILARVPIGRVALDTLWLGSAALLLAWHFVGKPVVDDPDLILAEQLAIITQISLLALLLGFVTTIVVAVVRARRPLFLLLSSPAVLLAAALALQARVGATGDLDHGTLADFAFPFAFGVGTVAVFESPRAALVQPVAGRPMAAQLGIAWLPLLAWLTMLGLEEADVVSHIGFLGFIVGVGAIVRLAGLLWENSRLLHDIHHRAHHDHLTGLPNRAALQEYLDAADRHPLALVLIDLDRFKTINDTVGYEAGDAVLIEAANRMKRSVDEGWLVARVAGDEFALVSRGHVRERELHELARHLVDELSNPFTVGEREFWLTATVGISATKHGLAPRGLLDAAETAMRKGKALATGEVIEATSGFEEEAAARRELEVALRHGIENDELRCLYQPKIDLTNGHLIGVEALVRWDRPGVGQVPPAAFIDVAEDSGLIARIDDWVLCEALRQLAEWNSLGTGHRLSISTNMSAWQLSRVDVHDQVAAAIGSYGQVDPGQLTIELTETALIEAPEVVARRLQRLRTAGVRVAIDDFGAGFTAIAYLREFPANEVKIDRTLVDELTGGPEDATSLAAAVIALGLALDLDVIAEGVETLEQAASLRRLGCRNAQGYLFARPVPADEISAMLTEDRAHPAIPSLDVSPQDQR